MLNLAMVRLLFPPGLFSISQDISLEEISKTNNPKPLQDNTPSWARLADHINGWVHDYGGPRHLQATDTVEACNDRCMSGGMSTRRSLPCMLPPAIFAYRVILDCASNHLSLLVNQEWFEP